jgi:hypothetical protein
MPNYDGKFVIMLDDDMHVYAHNWPVRTVDPTLQKARERSTVPSTIDPLNKDDWTAVIIENKWVYDNQGDTEAGAIYKLSAST